MEFKYKSDYQTQAVSSGLVDFQISYRSFTTATIWVTEDKFFGPGFCLRLMNEEKEEIGTAEFSITSKERTLYGKRARAYSLKRLGPPGIFSANNFVRDSCNTAPGTDLSFLERESRSSSERFD